MPILRVVAQQMHSIICAHTTDKLLVKLHSLHIRSLLSVCAALAITGCGEFRGIPSHGGGKRFDEEQRVVAGTIRQTLADIDLADLGGKRVLIVVEAIATDGGGNVQFPGVNSIGMGVNGNIGEGDWVQIVPNTTTGGSWLKNDSANNNIGGNAGINISPQTTYSSTAMGTAADIAYFKAALEMKARHVGITLVPAEPEVVLYVLIDILGTNRSRSDRLVVSNERLSASCECTYYAVDPKGGKLVFEARRASSESVYNEQRVLGDKNAHVSRHLYRTEPTRLPVDEPEKPTTQPTLPIEVIVDTRD
jgi:hypothetical protein